MNYPNKNRFILYNFIIKAQDCPKFRIFPELTEFAIEITL